MNKVRFEKDGQSIPIEDFAYQEAATREAFYGLLSGFGVDADKGFILSGCVSTLTDWMSGGVKIGDNIAISDGYISLSGEIFKVVSQNINVPTGQACYYEVDSNTAVATLRKVQGGSDFATQEQRRAKLVTSSAPPTVRMPYNAPQVSTVLRNKVYHKAMPLEFDPDAIGKTMADFFDESTGLGLVGGEFEGWAMMDGRNGTQDRRQRFVAGYDKDDTNYDLNKTGGEANVTLSYSQMPAHNHSLTMSPVNTGAGNGLTTLLTPSGTTNTAGAGGSDPHENRPPFVVSAWIIRLT